MVGKLGSKHHVAGQDKFFKYKKAQIQFGNKTSLNQSQRIALDEFFLTVTEWKTWDIDLLIILVGQGFTDLTDRFRKVKALRLRSLEYFIELWGKKEGQKQHEKLVKQASSNLITTNGYWEKRGLSKDHEAIRDHNSKGLNKIREMTSGSSDYTIRSARYWERKGHTPEQAREIVKKIQTKNGLKWYEDRYGEEGQKRFTQRINEWQAKLKHIMIEQGMWRSDDDLDAIQIYYRDISRHTEQNYRKHFSLINPENLPRDGKSFELDHKYSKMAGFRDGIPAATIGHWTNLEMLPASENCSKWVACSVSKDELLERFNENKEK